MEESIFRKSSLEKISSPEQLNDYMKVTSGGVWLLLLGLFALLLAAGVWAFTGTIPDTVKLKGVAYDEWGDTDVIYAYAPLAVSMRLTEGMNVQVSPEYAPREEFGYILGVIESVGDSPVYEEELLKRFGSMQLIAPIFPSGNPVEIKVRLKREGGELRWSSQKGEEITVAGGSYNQLLIVVRERKPYELILR
jgi:hypothetical protein